MNQEEILVEGLFSKMKDKKLVKKHTKDIDKAYEYINSKLRAYSYYIPFSKDNLLPSSEGGIIEFVAGYINLPKFYKSIYGPNINKIIESQQSATKVKDKLNSFNNMMDALSTDDVKAYFDYVHPENFYIDNKEGDFSADMYDFSSAPQLVIKLKTSVAKESAEILEEKAKIKSEDPDDAGYFKTNIKIKGANVVVCSRYHEEAEAQIKSMQKAFKNVEKSYSSVVESVANEIYNEWSKDHGEKLSRKEFSREIYKSKLQNKVIAYKDDYGFVFEFNYSINPVLGGKLLNISIYTDLDGLVSSYKYELESTIRRF